MSLTAALMILAQSAAPQAAEAPSAPPSRGVSVQVQASATIIRPARVTFDNAQGSALKVSAPLSAQVQRSRDHNGTVWAEFE